MRRNALSVIASVLLAVTITWPVAPAEAVLNSTPLKADAPSLSVQSQELARLLAVDGDIMSLSTGATQTEQPVAAENKVAIRQRLLETFLLFETEIHTVVSEIDRELSSANELRDVLQDRTERFNQKSEVANFVTTGTAEIISSALGLGPRRLVVPSEVANLVGGAAEVGISSGSLAISERATIKSSLSRNMLAPILGLSDDTTSYPKTVWQYLNQRSPNDIGSRRQILISRWVKLGKLPPLNTPKGRQQAALLCGRSGYKLKIEVLEDRALMLSDLRAAIEAMDEPLLELLSWMHSR